MLFLFRKPNPDQLKIVFRELQGIYRNEDHSGNWSQRNIMELSSFKTWGQPFLIKLNYISLVIKLRISIYK